MHHGSWLILTTLFAATAFADGPPVEPGPFLKSDLVELTKLDPSFKLDIRYATKNNFLGRPVYPEARAFLQRPAAEALARVHQALKKAGLGLLIFDGYRPWSVTKTFWDETPADKKDFVADPAKGSRHNRGCAVDLTLYALKSGRPLPMPSDYDEMNEKSHPDYAGGDPVTRANRDTLRKAMEAEGFSIYPNEWWHFDFKGWEQYTLMNLSFAEITPTPTLPRTGATVYPWLTHPAADAITSRFPPPPGFTRRPAPDGSFAVWLRGLPLKPGNPPVRLFNGGMKGYQSGHAAVLELDVGGKDLQQCADAVIRLRAEFLRMSGQNGALCFNFTSGHPAAWSKWRAGERPVVKGNKVNWKKLAAVDDGYNNFKKYLQSVFTYAGSLSLNRQLSAVADPKKIEPGDVFIRGGSPGHAVMVMDVVEDRNGHRQFMLAQSYMPAQEMHILKNPKTGESPWYDAEDAGELVTPEWIFARSELKRFVKPGCAP